MTKGTDSRNIERIVRGILSANGIDDLKLEVDLCTAWKRYVNERDAGETPATARDRIADEYPDGIYFGSEYGRERMQLRQEFMDIMQMDFGDDTKWDALLDHLQRAKAKGESIKTFAEWCNKDPYNSPKKHQIAQNPLLVKSVWKSAFLSPEEEKYRLL